ncbi:MAG: hypothetical protein PHE56_06720 [Bacteroidales bacterium]|nr:hypothetical protein [Bacteroidales bacterium]
MKKIETIIELCSDCKNSKEFIERDGNTDYVLICNLTNETLLRHTSVIKGRIHVDIPKSCPLEDYKPKS